MGIIVSQPSVIQSHWHLEAQLFHEIKLLIDMLMVVSQYTTQFNRGIGLIGSHSNHVMNPAYLYGVPIGTLFNIYVSKIQIVDIHKYSLISTIRILDIEKRIMVI